MNMRHKESYVVARLDRIERSLLEEGPIVAIKHLGTKHDGTKVTPEDFKSPRFGAGHLSLCHKAVDTHNGWRLEDIIEKISNALKKEEPEIISRAQKKIESDKKEIAENKRLRRERVKAKGIMGSQ
jgi:hypothetical protein